MKKIKRLTALMLAVVMVLAMSLTAFASGEMNETDSTEEPSNPTNNGYTITINNTATGHQYEAYQIFSGDLYEETGKGSVLSNITWGAGVSDAGKTALGDAAAKAEGLTEANAEDFAKAISQYLTTATGTSVYKAGTDGNPAHYEISNLPAGYYLIKDKDGALGSTTDTKTAFILKVVSNTSAAPKNSKIPTPDKSVKDKNDTTGVESEYGKTADYDIGDEIPYELKATLPEGLGNYKTYKLVFNDQLCNALDYVYTGDVATGVVVKKGNTVLSEGYTVEYSVETHKLTVTFADVIAAPVSATANDVITIEYKAKLNDQAVVGSAGNKNEFYLEYSNNPNDESTGTTEKITAIVFTFKTVVNKVEPNGKDENGNDKFKPLAGAEFTLEKLVKENGQEVWKEVKVLGTNGENVSFEFSGLDDGRYRLTETKTPQGYNTIEPVYFTIEATHDDTTKELTSLRVYATHADGTTLADGEDNVTEFAITMIENTKKPEGTVTTDIVNKKGSLLPSTGGIGTTIFYIVGAILVIGAGVILVVKKRMSNE